MCDLMGMPLAATEYFPRQSGKFSHISAPSPPRHLTSTMIMKFSLRLLCVLTLASLFAGKSFAQVVMTVDWSNRSAVKFTATGANSAINYSNAWTFVEGVALLNFFTAPVNVQDLDNGTTGASTLTDSANNAGATSTFNRLSSWNDANPNLYPNGGNGSDLTLWNDPGSTKMTFTTAGAAFYGEAVFDLSNYAGFTSLFPALGATGNVGIWNGNGTLGTWEVVGAQSAVPEPSTYAALAGIGALVLVVLRRRRAALSA